MATQTTLLGLTKPDYSDVQDVGVINANMEIIDQEMGKRSSAHSFLGNGDFAVNQRGQSEYTATGYAFDRWRFRSSNGGKVQKLKKGIRITAGTSGICGVYQRIATQDYTRVFDALAGEPVTLAIKVSNNTLDSSFYLQMSDNNGTTTEASGSISILSKSYPSGQTGIMVATGTMPNTMTNDGILVSLRTNSGTTSGSIDIERARLYKGTYTADNLPAAIEKDCSADMLESQQFLHGIIFDGATITPLAVGIANNASNLRFTLDLPVPFADIGAVPVAQIGETVVLRAYNGSTYQQLDNANVSVKYAAGNRVLLEASGQFTQNAAYVVTGHTTTSNPTKIFISNEP